MILHYVTDRSQLLIQTAAAFDTEGLRHGELHAPDVLAIPKRLEEGVGKTEVEQVLHRLLAEKMIDAENPRLLDRKSTRLNSSHSQISYAVFCLKKKKK